MNYHNAIRCIQKNEDMIRSEKMASKLSSSNNQLWKEAKKMRGKNNQLPEIVDNISGDENISNLFSSNFYEIFNSVGYNMDELNKIRNEID